MKDTLNYNSGTFDSRVVQYEKVHQITEEQKEYLLKAIDLQEKDVLLDACCGYGSVTQWLLEMQVAADFYLCDESSTQIERARENLPKSCNIISSDVKSLPYEDAFFDKVVIKMGLHENPDIDQQVIVNEFFRVLKPGGKLIIWELYLNEKTQPIFQKVIRKKDQLAGFTSLVKKRYFQRKDEMKHFLDMAGFIDFKEVFVFNPALHTKVRLNELVSLETKEEVTDVNLLELAQSRLNELNETLRSLTDEEKEVIGMKDLGEDILIHNIEKGIVTAMKPK